MTTEPRAVFVVGYIADVDELPRDVEKLRLPRRIAMIMDSSSPSSPETVFDQETYERFVRCVIDLVKPEAMIVRDEGNETTVHSIDETRQLQLRRPMEEREPFERIVLLKDGKAVAMIGSEPWANIGGPQPYNDDFVVPLFTAEDVSQQILSAVKPWTREVIIGTEGPRPPGLGRRLRNMFW